MIPIRDDNPTHSTPVLTIALIALNTAIFIFQATLPAPEEGEFVWKYGFVPAKLTHDSDEFRAGLVEHAPVVPATDRFGRIRVDMFGRALGVRQQIPEDAATALPAWVTIFTCMFLHGGWMHLLGNMLYLWIFGNNIEDRLGPVLFGVFYLGTGVMGNLLHTVAEASWMPLVGASGAISGVMGAYLVLFGRAAILALVPLGFFWFTVKLPAWMFLGIYIVVQNLYPASFGRADSVAYWAHIGGFFSGLALIVLFPKRHRPVAARPSPINDDDADFVL